MAFTVGELAKLTGVTVRALHHFDELGLVRPSGRSDAGYRLYDDANVMRLQQVLVYRELARSSSGTRSSPRGRDDSRGRRRRLECAKYSRDGDKGVGQLCRSLAAARERADVRALQARELRALCRAGFIRRPAPRARSPVDDT